MADIYSMLIMCWTVCRALYMDYALESLPLPFQLGTIIHIWEMKGWKPGEAKYVPRSPSWLAYTTEPVLLMSSQYHTL